MPCVRRNIGISISKTRLNEEIINPATEALAAALLAMEPEAWRAVLREVTYGFQEKQLDAPFEKLTHFVARKTVGAAVPWYGHNKPDEARAAVDEMLAPAGIQLQYPGAEPAQTETVMPDESLHITWLRNYTDNHGRTWADLTDSQTHHRNSPCYQAFVTDFPGESDPKFLLKQARAALLRETAVWTGQSSGLTRVRISP